MRTLLSAVPVIAVTTVRRKQAWVHKWSRFMRWQEMEKDMKEDFEHTQRMRNFKRFPGGMYLTPERPEDVRPPKALEDQTRKETGVFPIDLYTNHTQMRYIDHSFDNIRRFNRYSRFQGLQRMIPERLLFLGPDLAAAHFLVHRGAAIKFVGDEVWYKRDAKGYSLPGRKVPGLHIEAIDASGTELMFEGFENLHDLEHLRMLRVAGCQYIDDWVVGKIGGCMPRLEMLDLSGCHRVSAKGLMGLKHLKRLRYLRLEGLEHVPELGHSALLLEEAIPSLTVLGVDYEAEVRRVEAENRLLANDRVVLDAKGNAFAEDDNGRLFYLHGTVNERIAVDDEDRPIMTSTVRRETPAMSDEEFEELNVLSNGKLRHLLVGSPSGYNWNEQHEAKLLEKDGIPIDPKMLPQSARKVKQPQLDERSVLDALKLEDVPQMELPDPYLPGAISLLDQLDKRLIICMRDGRKLIGCLRSIDQFANLVLDEVVERTFFEKFFCDIPHGFMLIRGENVVLAGEIDEAMDTGLTRVTLEQMRLMEGARSEELQRQNELRIKAKRKMDDIDENF